MLSFWREIFIFSYDPKSSEMMSHLENIAVNPEACVENFCHENCHLVLCELCSTCLGETNLQNLHEAHLEHKRRGGFKRIFPRTHFSFTDLTPNNKVSSKWFAAKCFMDPDWCWVKLWFFSCGYWKTSNLSSLKVIFNKGNHCRKRKLLIKLLLHSKKWRKSNKTENWII